MYTRGTFFFLFLGMCSLWANGSPLFPAEPEPLFKQAGFLFIENKGQLKNLDGTSRSDILYTLKGEDISVFVHRTGLYYQFRQKKDSSSQTEYYSSIGTGISGAGQNLSADGEERDATILYRFGMQLQEGNSHARVVGQKETPYYENYYNLPGQSPGLSKVRSFERVLIKDIYPNIDWLLYIQDGRLKYDFIVHPGGKVQDIKMKYSGIDALSSLENGSLEICTPLGKLTEGTPYTYQQRGLDAKEISSHYTLLDSQTVGFSVSEYLADQPLIIDPSIHWASYYGGAGFESGTTTAIDRQGNVYLGGSTESFDAIADDGHQQTIGGRRDAFVVKFDANGNRLWATYFGGEGDDEGNQLKVDREGNLYFIGWTDSREGIAYNGFQDDFAGGGDAFLVKFNVAGERSWATYYGGEGLESGHSVAIDGNDDIYISGITESAEGIASGGFQNEFGGSFDVFLAKFNSRGDRIWGTYYGGSGEENTRNGHRATVAVDGQNNIYLAGWSSSAEGIASGGFQNSLRGNGDAFLVKFNGAGNRLWATYYGGEGFESGRSIAIGQEGAVYLSGTTNSAEGIAFEGFQETIGGHYDAFLVKFTAAGERIWGTYYGGSDQDEAKEGGLSIDGEGYVYMGGFTNSSSNIASCGFQNSLGGSFDAFVVKFYAGGNRQWGSYYGGGGFEISFESNLDQEGNLYMVGWSTSPSGIVSGGFQNNYGGGGDAFLVKIDPAKEQLEAPEIRVEGEMPLCPEQSIGLSVPFQEGLTYEWRRADQVLEANGHAIRVSKAGKYTVSLQSPCDTVSSDTLVVTGFENLQVPAISASGPTSFCAGDSILLSVPLEAGIGYQWQKDGEPLGDNSPSLTVKETGFYTCILTNECGSLSAEGISVDAGASPAAPLAPKEVRHCGPGKLLLQAEGGTEGAYRWYASDTARLPIEGETGAAFTTPELYGSTTYYVSLLSGNCESTRTAIQVLIDPPALADAGKDTLIQLGEELQLQAGGGEVYRWSPAEGLSDPNIANPVAKPERTTVYTVTVSNEYGCQATDDVQIRVAEGAIVPNAFSPNQDGRNDVWEIFNVEAYPEMRVLVFNRWGQKVYESVGYREPWDGTYRGKKLPPGSYAYIIWLGKERQPQRGSLVLLR